MEPFTCRPDVCGFDDGSDSDSESNPNYIDHHYYCENGIGPEHGWLNGKHYMTIHSYDFNNNTFHSIHHHDATIRFCNCKNGTSGYLIWNSNCNTDILRFNHRVLFPNHSREYINSHKRDFEKMLAEMFPKSYMVYIMNDVIMICQTCENSVEFDQV